MTYKEYYLSLNSIEDIMEIANADMALACVINPDRIAFIRQSAEEAIKEKFGIEQEVKREAQNDNQIFI